MKHSRIAGTGSYLPEKVLTNLDLEKMMDTSDQWIRERTGIVVKSHGRADGVAFSRAIITAALAARRGLTAHIAQALAAQGAEAPLGATT